MGGREFLHMTSMHDIGPSFCTNKTLRAICSQPLNLEIWPRQTVLALGTQDQYVLCGVPQHDIEVPLHQWDMNSAPPPTFLPSSPAVFLAHISFKRPRGEGSQVSYNQGFHSIFARKSSPCVASQLARQKK